MYAEVDFLLALVKDDDWLGERAEEIYRDHREDLWTSEYALLELMLVAYREDRNVESTVANAKHLLEVRGDAETMLAAASHVEENDFTPLDAIHLVRSGEDPVVTSDQSYEAFSKRVALEPET